MIPGSDLPTAPDGVRPAVCPGCGTAGTAVKIVTLKALLSPTALATVVPTSPYRFCPDGTCDVVYFSVDGQYHRADVKVPVFQKEAQSATPVCYCFGHSRSALSEARSEGRGAAITQSIQAHIRAGRCGCEVNNPQGTCCLGNVNRVLAGPDRASQR